MKNIILLGAMLFLNFMANASEAVNPITYPIQEYQFIYCKQLQNVSAETAFKHYLIDTRNEDINAIYTAMAAANINPQNITTWIQEDNNFAHSLVRSSPDFDLYIVSNKAKLEFKLSATSDGGEGLKGSIFDAEEESKVLCTDIAYLP